jgi:transposase
LREGNKIWYNKNINANTGGVIMLSKKHEDKSKDLQVLCLDDLVPPDHILRKIAKAIDFSFIYDLVKDKYCEDNGRPSVDPVVLIKIIMLQYMFGIRSMRQTIKEIEVNMAYRWFIGYDFFEKIPHFSTFGKNYVRRFKDTSIFEDIFMTVIKRATACGFVDENAVFIDSTHVKASANKHKYIKAKARIAARGYQKQLDIEIDADREAHGKDPLPEKDEEPEEREIKQSTTDPESGQFVKSEKERCFAHSVHTACDKNGFILDCMVTPGNVNDGKAFFDFYDGLTAKYPNINSVVMDAGYKTAAICKWVMKDGRTPVLPYKCPMTKEGYFKKYEYAYDEYYDCYVCPANQVLSYKTTNREGYRQYESNPASCANCPLKKQCLTASTGKKMITRHVWEAYYEEAEHIRHTDFGKELYRKRSETIERVFADAKEKHAMRYTHLRGNKKLRMVALLTYSCMNLKKLAMWLERGKFSFIISLFSCLFDKHINDIHYIDRKTTLA